ncbi:MAG: TSUP family transporter [Verrucomicrobiae bacterium]|nr:TSUP family transporter [Verrucomicrobiae bacterium]
MDTWWYPVLFATGVAAGYVDAIAGGGGLITVPVLMATGLSPADALGTNKLQSACGTTLATMRYARHGLLGQGDWTWGIAATVVGAAAGSWCVQQVNPGFLRPLIPILLVTIAIVLITRPDLGSRPRAPRLAPRPFGILFGLLLGFYDGFLGPGTGAFWMMACVGLLGRDLLAATAHTKVMNLTSNLASLVLFLAGGHVRFAVGLSMAAGQFLGGWLGARSAIHGGARRIRRVLLTVVILLAAKLLWDAVRAP